MSTHRPTRGSGGSAGSSSSSVHFPDLSTRLGYLDLGSPDHPTASLVPESMEKRPGGSLNSYIRVQGGRYLVLCDTLKRDEKDTPEGKAIYILDENTSKCQIIGGRIAVTAVGDCNRQQEMWSSLELIIEALEDDEDYESPDVHDIKGWVDDFMMENQVDFDDSVEVYMIGYSRKFNMCIALLSRDIKGGGPDLTLSTDYPYEQSYEALGTGSQYVEEKWSELGIDDYINRKTKEMSYENALFFLKQGFLEASLQDVSVGGYYQAWLVESGNAREVEVEAARHFTDIALEMNHPFEEEKQLLFFDNRPYDEMYKLEMATIIMKEVLVEIEDVVPFGEIRNGWKAFLVTFKNKRDKKKVWNKCNSTSSVVHRIFCYEVEVEVRKIRKIQKIRNVIRFSCQMIVTHANSHNFTQARNDDNFLSDDFQDQQ